jgi:hypothetical protein
MLADLTCEHFEHRVNQVSRVSFDSGDLEFRLVECRRLKSRGRSEGDREPFSLTFLGPRLPVLPQRIYNFDFGELGAFDVFIVPIGSDRSGTTYEAVFA